MKNLKRNPVERFCALLLAFIMVFTLVLPDGALSVSAAEGTTIVEFRIKDAGNADSLLVDNQTIKVWKTGEDSVTEVPYDSNQGIYSIQLDSNTEYQYSVERNGYEYADGNNTRTFNLGEEDNYLVEVSLKQSVASGSEQTENSGTNEEESLPQETETPEQNVENNQEQLLIQPFLGESVPEKPDLNVKTDIEGSTLDITSDGQIDVKSITCTVNGLPEDATGTLTFTIKNSSNEEIGKTELDIASQGTKWTFDEADKIIGKLSITAFYSGNDKYNQVEYNSAELTYKKTAPINFSKDASNEVVIKDNATKKESEIDATTIENIKERNLEYSSNDKNIATVDNKGKITAKKAGIATITIKAVENEYYESSELQFTVYVQHAMGLSDLNWTAKKVYDGTKDLKLSSTLKDSIIIDGTAISNITATVTATADKAGVSAKNATIKKGEKVTFNGKVNNQNLDEKTLAKLNRCYVFEDSKDALIENAVTITARPLYVRIAKKNGAYESAIPYRTSKKDMESTIKTDNTVVLVGSKGAIDSDKESGLVGKDTVQDAEKALKNQTEIQFNSKEDYSKYYEGLYNKAIVLKVNNAKYDDNYEFKANPDEENLYGRLQITQEVIDDATVGKNISVISAVGESVEESEKNAEKVYQGKDFTWVSASAKIQFVTNLAPYNKVNVAGLETLSMANYADKIKENSIVDISDWKLPIYLEASEGSEHFGMRTTADAKAQNVANKIPENKVKVDNEKPTIEFIGEIKDLTRIYTNKEFNVAYQISDNGSGIKEASYAVLSVKNLNTVTSDEIEKAVNAVTNWTPFEGEAKKAGTVKISNEKDANKIVVIKAVDQVGNISAYTSNGIVIDITSPEVTLSIDNSKQVNGIYGGNKTAIKYSVNVNDPVKQSDGMEVQSEINRVEIEVQKNDVKDAEHSFVIEGDELEKMKSEEASETGAFIYKIQKEIPVQEESSQIKILVTAFDKAGNSLAQTSETLQVDGKKPEIEAKYDGEKLENGCYKERKLTVTYIEREFSEDNAEFKIEFNDEKESKVALSEIRAGKVDGVSVEGEPKIEAGTTPDDKKSTYTIKFGKENFDCTVKLNGISLKDQAGNSNSVDTANEEFTVDQVAPKINVEFDNNDVKNGEYFNDIRQMTVTYTERNFDENNLRFKVSEEEKTLKDFLAINGIKQVGTRTDNGNEHKYTFEFGEDDNDFDFNVTPEITDKSGNANQGVTYTEGTKAGKEFTVDRVAPVLEVKYFTYKDKEGKEGKYEITEGIEKTKDDKENPFYKNAPIDMEISIKERNFDKESLKLNYTAIDALEKTIEDAKATSSEWDKKTKTFKFDKEANYTLNSIEYTDLAGNSLKVAGQYYFTVDKTAPTGKIIMSSDTNEPGIKKQMSSTTLFEKFENFIFGLFSNNKINLTMEGEDTISSVDEIKYYLDEGATGIITNLEKLNKNPWTLYTAPLSFNKENSKFVPYLYLKDKAGNETYITSNGVIYDTAKPNAPQITITTKEPVLAGVSDSGIEIFNSDVEFSISVEDPVVNGTYSGLASVSYKIINNGTVTQKGSFDKELKPASMMVQSIENKEVKVEASKNNSNDIVIEVTATDNAGNTTTEKKQIAIDTTPPEITVSYDNNNVANGKYFKADRTMTVEYKERNFDESKLTFDVTTNGKSQTVSLSQLKNGEVNGIKVISGPEDSEKTKEFETYTDNRTNTYKILFNAGGNNGDMDYSIVPHIIDKANNKQNKETQYKAGTEAKTEFTIDKKAPVISMAYSAEGETINPGGNEVSRVYRNKTITATATIEERNFSNSNSFSEDPKQMNLTYEALNFQGSKVNTENYTGTANTRGEWSTNVYTRTKTFTFSQDANYTLGLVYRDLAGNEAVYDTRYFTVDKTAPTGSMTIEDNSGTAKTWIQWIQQVFFDIFTQSQKGVSMTSADETAGVASTQYYKYHPDSESRHTFDGLSTQNLDSISSWSDGYSTSVNADEQVIVYEKITDRAGNVTYINNQEGVIADNTSPTAPEIKITAAEPAQGIYNASVPFTIDVTDPENGGTYAGLKEVSYEITNNGKVTQSGNYNSDLSDPTARVHNIHRSETVNAELNNSNHVTIKVKAVDYAGNQSEATKDLKIDITHPEVTITFDLNNPLNGKYYKTTRTATISVKERNFDTNAVDLKITNTDGTMPSVSGWSISSQAGESDDAINTCRVEFSADGDYNMTMQCKDQAGNESNTVKVDEFTIDKTIPVISVSYDNNSAVTPGYYNANRTATITIKEHNFNAAEVNSQITAALQGSGISAPGVGGWSNSGDTHTASVTFSDDGDYTFDIDYTDLAGNAAADYTQDSFTVDKTKPEVEFFDIEDKSANNGVVAPGVKYSDVNYLESGVEIKIEGAEHESKELTGSRSSIANGESIKMNDFEYTQDNDDVYTMTAVISDKAGNKTEKKIMFSVNRFGSNYSFSDTTKEFLDEVYSNSAKDLVITETNVDSLVFNGISYSLDNKTTELKQGTDYTVKETGGEGSWKQYTYTIKKENFEKEGRYSVTIDSEDKATNTMNNKVKERNINFVIDKTPPTVVITGIEESSYRADSRDMSVNVSDNTAVKRLDIMVDGKSVATYSQEDVKEAGGKIVYTLNSSNSKQKVKAVAVDMADNEANSDNHNILITTNLFIQYINNKPLFIGSIIALVLIAGGVIYFFVFRRKKSEDAADAN